MQEFQDFMLGLGGCSTFMCLKILQSWYPPPDLGGKPTLRGQSEGGGTRISGFQDVIGLVEGGGGGQDFGI